MTTRKQKFSRSKSANIRWFAALSVLLLAYWWVMANFVIRNFWDPPYARKFERLTACLKAYPQRPLWLVMGSSHVEYGLRPGILAGRMDDKNAPVIFNFGMGGSGVFREFIYLRRLLQDGIRPQRVGIEVFSVDFNHELIPTSQVPELLVRARKDELDDYLRYSSTPPGFISDWRRSRWDPFFQYGMRMSSQTLALRLIPLPGMSHLERNILDKWGWPPVDATTPENVYRWNFEVMKNVYKSEFENFKISTNADLLLHGILDMCGKAGIQVFLLKMPESEDFRALHTPQSDAVFAAYLAKIQGEYGVPLVDASSWVATDGFSDGHHMNATGGAVFTRRLVDELSTLKFQK